MERTAQRGHGTLRPPPSPAPGDLRPQIPAPGSRLRLGEPHYQGLITHGTHAASPIHRHPHGDGGKEITAGTGGSDLSPEHPLDARNPNPSPKSQPNITFFLRYKKNQTQRIHPGPPLRPAWSCGGGTMGLRGPYRPSHPAGPGEALHRAPTATSGFLTGSPACQDIPGPTILAAESHWISPAWGGNILPGKGIKRQKGGGRGRETQVGAAGARGAAGTASPKANPSWRAGSW